MKIRNAEGRKVYNDDYLKNGAFLRQRTYFAVGIVERKN